MTIRLSELISKSVRRLVENDESEATKQAHQLGLVSKGWGRWADPKTGKLVAKSINGRLVKYPDTFEDDVDDAVEDARADIVKHNDVSIDHGKPSGMEMQDWVERLADPNEISDVDFESAVSEFTGHYEFPSDDEYNKFRTRLRSIRDRVKQATGQGNGQRCRSCGQTGRALDEDGYCQSCLNADDYESYNNRRMDQLQGY